MDRPLRERRDALQRLSRRRRVARCSTRPPRRPKSTTAEADRRNAFCAARDCRNEGLVLKDPDSLYSPGRRGQTWLKLKTHLPTLDCVVTAAEYGHGKRRNVAERLHVRRLGSRAERERRDAGEHRQSLQRRDGRGDRAAHRDCSSDIAIEQRLAGCSRGAAASRAGDRVRSDPASAAPRQRLRAAFPAIKRIRWDKRPQDADRLSRVIEMYHSTANFGRRRGPLNRRPRRSRRCSTIFSRRSDQTLSLPSPGIPEREIFAGVAPGTPSRTTPPVTMETCSLKSE